MDSNLKKITINMVFDSEEEARIIASSLQPEMQKDFSNITIYLKQEKSGICIDFISSHTPLLRAAINSYIRWIETAYSISSI